MQTKTIIFVADGMADEPIDHLGGKTPLQYAKTPAMDSIAQSGMSGTLLTLPPGFPTGSEAANMSILGCDLEGEYCGRGPMEALGKGLNVSDNDRIFRLNIITQSNGILLDFSAGNITQTTADKIISELNSHFGSDQVSFHSGISYRNLLVLSGTIFTHDIETHKPDDIQGNAMDEYLPFSANESAAQTIRLLTDLIHRAPEVVSKCSTSANGVWPWGGGSIKPVKSFSAKFGIDGAVISGVDVIRGIGRSLGMKVIDVPAAKHYSHSDYETKADAALEAIQEHDLIYIHEDSPDEASHQKDLEGKIKAIEAFDQKIVAQLLENTPANTSVAVLPDHFTTLSTGKHTREPVPVSVRIAGAQPDTVRAFNEISCRRGSLGIMHSGQLLKILLKR